MMKSCEMLSVLSMMEPDVPHYHGSVEADTEVLNSYKGRSGFFMKKFLIGDQMNMNEWRVTWDAIKKDIWGFKGKPVVLTPNLDHPSVPEQNDFRVGEIIDVGIDELTRTAWQVSQIFDKKAQKMISEKNVRFGSPTVLKYSDDTVKEMRLGNGQLQSTLHRFVPAHDAIVGEPAYGKEVDKIKAICKGDGKRCGVKLMAVSASVNSDNIDQLTIVPFVKKTLNANFSDVTLKQMVEFSKNTRQGDTSESCVSRKIKIIADENPSMPHDQVIAIAYSYCNDKSASIQKMIIADLAPEIIKNTKRLRTEISTREKLINSVRQLLKGS